MELNTRGRYAVTAMADIAKYGAGRAIPLSAVAGRQHISLAYLEQLVKLLRESEPPLVASTRGAHGGYRLSRPPEEITMGEIVRVLEGPIAPMICATEGEMTQICGYLEACKTRYLWAKVRDGVAHTLDTMTLADLLGASEEAETMMPAKFIAVSDIHVANSAAN